MQCQENAEPRKYKKCTPADKEVLAKLMRDDITLEETDLAKEKKKIWEEKKSILSSMLAGKPEEVMEIVNGAAFLATKWSIHPNLNPH